MLKWFLELIFFVINPLFFFIYDFLDELWPRRLLTYTKMLQSLTAARFCIRARLYDSTTPTLFSPEA